MRETGMAALGAAASVLVLELTGTAGALYSWRVAAGDGAASGVLDLGLSLPRALAGPDRPLEALVMAGSILGWVLCLPVLADRRGRPRFALLLHPAAIIMVAGGLGLAFLGLSALIVILYRMSREGRPGDVPLLGLALLLAAATVPRFELLFLAVVSPLFLLAPKDMLKRNMAAFYIIVLAPTLLLLTIAAGFGPQAMTGSDLPRPEPMFSIAAPVTLAAPAAALAVAAPRLWRLAVVLGALVTAAFLGSGASLFWPVALAGLGGAFSARFSGHRGLEVVHVGAVTLAAFLVGGHVAG